MPIKSYKVGPGLLTVGDPLGDYQDLRLQVTSCEVQWTENVESGDPIPVLGDGEELPGEDDVSYAAALAFNVLQDPSLTGSIAWSWEQKGVEHPFSFVPNTTEGTEVTGVLRVAPLNLGGEVSRSARPRSDATWRCIGDPTMAAYTP